MMSVSTASFGTDIRLTSRCPSVRSPNTYSTLGLVADGFTVIFHLTSGRSKLYSTLGSLKELLWAKPNDENRRHKPKTKGICNRFNRIFLNVRGRIVTKFNRYTAETR